MSDLIHVCPECGCEWSDDGSGREYHYEECSRRRPEDRIMLREARHAAKCPECKAPIGEIHTFGCSRYPEVMRENIEERRGPLLDPLAMPPEELAKLKLEGYGHLIAKPRRMDDVPGYRRDW